MGVIVKQSGTLGPVTALSICGDKILAGCGQLIQVYGLESGLLEVSFQGLSHSNIHGIRPGPFIADATHLCLFGGKQSRVVAIKSKSSECIIEVDECSSEEDFEDWLWDAVWLQKQDWWTIGFALAHNIVLHWDWRNSKILQRVTCTEKCLLYCARFIGSSWSELFLAVGTVFNHVVLWSVGDRHDQSMSDGFFVEPNYSHQSRQVLCRLTGHEGVIFSINYQPKLQRLCSVSDDRSIRVWQIHSASSNAECIPVSSLDWNYVHIEPMLTLYGHSARVWDALLLSEKIISVGEDASCLVWNYCGEIVQQFRGHKGRSIWSVAASEDESFVVTGGGDASLRQWHLKDAVAVELSHVVLPIPDDIKISEDFIRTLTLWNFDTVVLATNQGMLLAHNISDGSWKKLWHDTAFSSYVTLAFSPSRAFLAVGNVTGLVAVFERHEGLNIVLQSMIQPHKGKICGLTWVDECHFVTTGLHGHCVMTRLYLDVEENRAMILRPMTQLELPESQHRWVTAGCLLSSFLVCGDRCGSIYKYGLSLSADETSICRPTQIFKKIHGSAGVTCICYHDSTIFTAGRDGQYRQWTIKNGDLELLNTSRVFKGFDWIDRLVFQENEFQIMGFYSSKFIVWSVTKGEQLLEVECGGGHRAWDCVYQGCICRFLFLKTQQVALVTSNQKNRQVIIKPSLHGQKVWAMKHLYTHECFPGRPMHVVCMASEDTTVSIGTLWAENGSLHWLPQHTIHSHLSSVRALAVVNETIYPVSNIYKTTKKHGQKQCISQGNDQGCTAWTEQCHGDILDISQDTGTLSQNEAYDKLSSALEAERSYTANQENTKEWLHSQTKIVFSGGGRAQIQAWRVFLEPNARAYLKQGELSGARDCKLFRSSAPLAQDQKPTIPPTLHAGSSAEQSSMQTSYKHLGSCFLGEARHKRSAKPWKTRYLKLDPETRIMDLAAIATQSVDSRLPAGTYLLAAAGSDGVLRLFLFEERSCLFFLLCQSSYHSGCLLKVYMHLLPDDNYSRPVLLSAATDGKIALWDLQPVCVWLLQHFFQEPETISEDSSDDEDSHIFQESKNKESYAWHGCSNRKTQTAMDKETGCQTDSDQKYLRSNISAGSKVNNQSFFYHNFADSLATDTAKYDSEDAKEEENEEELSSGGLITEENANDLSKTKAQDLTESQQTSLQGFLLVNSTCEWIPNKEVKSHQSGINSLHMKSFGDRQVLLASGGDDNSLTVHYLRFETPCTADMEHQLFQVESTVARSDAHAGQITGVWILSERLVLTASLDQRVSLWNLTEEENILKIAMKDSQFVDIADLSNIDVWQHGNVIHVGVCGEGIVLLTLDL